MRPAVLHSGADKAEARLEQECVRHVDRGENTEMGGRVGEDLLGGNRPSRSPERHRGAHVVGLPLREDYGANESPRGRAEKDPDDHHEVQEARSRRRR